MATPTATSTHLQQASSVSQDEHIDDATKAQIIQLNRAFSVSASKHQLDAYLLKLLHCPNKLYYQNFFPGKATPADLDQRVDAFIQTFKEAQRDLLLKSSEEYITELAKIHESNKLLGTTLSFNLIATKMRLVLGGLNQLAFDVEKAEELDLELQGNDDASISQVARNILSKECHRRVQEEYRIYQNDKQSKIAMLKNNFESAGSRLELSKFFVKLMQDSAELYLTIFFPAGSTTEDLPLRVLTFFKKFKETQEHFLSLSSEQRQAENKEIKQSDKALATALFLHSTAAKIHSALVKPESPTINTNKMKQLEAEFKSYENQTLKRITTEFLYKAFKTRVAQIRPSHQGEGAAAQPLPERTLKLTPSKHQIDAETKPNKLKRKREAEGGKEPLHASPSDLADNGSQGTAGPDLSNSKRIRVDQRIPDIKYIERAIRNNRLGVKVPAILSSKELVRVQAIEAQTQNPQDD